MKIATLRYLAVGVLAASTMYASALTTFVHEGIIYKNSKNNLTIQKPGTKLDSGTAPTEYTGDVVIPKTIVVDGTTYTVTAAAAAFKGTGITSITFPEGVSFSRGAFQGCESLTSIVLPADLDKMVADFFNGCTALTSVTIPGKIPEILSSTFKDCTSLETLVFLDGEGTLDISTDSFGGKSYVKKLELNRPLGTKYTDLATKPWRGNGFIEEVVIGGHCTTLPSNYFENAAALKSATITSDFTSFGTDMFVGTALSSFEMPAGVTSVPSSMFAKCPALKTVTLSPATKSIDAMAFQNSALESIVLPETLTTIGQAAFAGTKLSGEIVLPAAVKSVGIQAYANIAELTGISFPATLTTLGHGVAMNSPKVTKFTIDAECEAYATTADGSTIISKDGTTVVCYAPAAAATAFTGEYTAVTPYAFYKAVGLESIELPACAEWGDYAAYGSGVKALSLHGNMGRYIAASCPALTDLTINGGYVPVGVGADCPELTNVTLLAPVAVVRQDAFKNAPKVENLDLGNLLSILESGCFTGCGLKAITVAATHPAAMAEGVFTAESAIDVTVPADLVETYKAAAGWSYLTIKGDVNLAAGPADMGMPAGLYYAGDDSNLHCVYADGQTDDYETGLDHMFQLVEFSNRIYGASAGKKFWYSATSATEGDGKLFYISKVGNEVFQAVVLDNAGNNAYKDPTGLYIYGSTLYVNDRNVCVRKISADALALPQDYPSWMENNWMPFYSNPWTYGCIKNGFAITEDQDINGNPEPLYWVGMKYNGCGMFTFKEKNIGTSSENVGPMDGATAYLVNLSPITTSFAVDDKNGHLYMYIETGGTKDYKVYGGLYRVNIEDLQSNPDPAAKDFVEALNPVLIDGAPVKYEGNATNEHVGISQLAMDEKGEYLYWCYRAPEDEAEAAKTEDQSYDDQVKGRYYWAEKYDAENPLHHSGIKRIKLGEEKPEVEMVVPGVTGYGIVPVRYEGSSKPVVEDGVQAVNNDGMVAAISINGSDIVVSEDALVSIYSTSGLLVNVVNAVAGQTITTEGLAAGVYLVDAQTTVGRQTVKLAK